MMSGHQAPATASKSLLLELKTIIIAMDLTTSVLDCVDIVIRRG
jgi:hypothetical protein